MSEMLGESTISEVQLVRDSTRGPMAGPTHAQKGLFQLKLEGSQCEGGMLQVRISELLLSDGKGDEREGKLFARDVVSAIKFGRGGGEVGCARPALYCTTAIIV